MFCKDWTEALSRSWSSVFVCIPLVTSGPLHVYVYIYTHIYIYICLHICMYIYIHIMCRCIGILILIRMFHIDTHADYAMSLIVLLWKRHLPVPGVCKVISTLIWVLSSFKYSYSYLNYH